MGAIAFKKTIFRRKPQRGDGNTAQGKALVITQIFARFQPANAGGSIKPGVQALAATPGQ